MTTKTIIQKTLRVPAVAGPAGDGGTVARQMDAVLVGAGFKASRGLLEHVSGLAPGAAMDLAVQVIGAVRELIGDQVAHNPYFLNFPGDVPGTVEHWLSCLRDGLVAVGAEGDPEALLLGPVNLLDLPTYGTYQHTYAEMLAAHDELVPSVKDRVTVLHLGGSLEEETRSLYLDLAASATPLGEADLGLLAELAAVCLDGAQPETVPVRENRAVLNAARLVAGRSLVAVDTVTDILRLACQASDGDVTLQTPTRFRAFRRPERRVLMAALDRIVADNPAKLGDVARYARRWQRLGERIHPHEYDHPHARDVFAVARGDRTVRSLAGRVELAFRAGDTRRAVDLLGSAPGMLLRQLDRLLRCDPPADPTRVLAAVRAATGAASGRVLCALREHLDNRAAPDIARVFANRGRRAWVTPDRRPPLDAAVVAEVTAILDDALSARLPAYERLVVDPAVLTLALPLSGHATEDGFGVLPRGSVLPVDGEVLRFFTYWKQTEQTTDFDLSALLLGDDYAFQGHVSWTSHHHEGAYYSGDITDAPDGATEFIDIPLGTVSARYVVPQVNVYSGEGFDEVAESMFGYMTRDLDQLGAPFEPSTVRVRSALRGSGRVALPVMFVRGDDGSWSATWLNVYGRGSSWGNRVEAHRYSTALMARAIQGRRHLTVGYLVELLAGKAGSYQRYTPELELTEPVTYVGIERPEGLPEGSEVVTLDRLNSLVPE
ncbi:MAG: hypothetical protein WCA46_02165 [Actinocatenispora sp.]